MAAAAQAPKGSRFVVAGGTDVVARFGVEPAFAHTFGNERIEMALPTEEQKTSEEPLRADTAAMRQMVKEALYE